ncbi:N-6 DNA methylase [Vibrio owensii]|uniref:N-6 DNA methylase n=1 Tax=Vibrio harveyi group TaxID=717610 RepID=UPI003CC673F3
MNHQQLYNSAFRLIESWRYKFTISSTLRLFVSDWAYQQSGLYPVDDPILKTKEYQDVAKPLTHIIAALMMNGVSDPLAVLLSEFCKEDNKHLSYFPTPSGISKLMGEIMARDVDLSEPIRIYEPCCGTAGMILDKLEMIYQQNITRNDPLGNVTVVVEDISSVALNAFFLQFVFKLQYLESTGQKPALPKHVTMTQLDVLSRKRSGPIYYELSSPVLHAENSPSQDQVVRAI